MVPLHDNDSGSYAHVDTIARTMYKYKNITDFDQLIEPLCIHHGAKNIKKEGRITSPQGHWRQGQE